MRAIFLCGSILILQTFYSQAQSPIDSLKQVLKEDLEDTIKVDLLNEISFLFNHKSVDSLQVYANKALILSKRLDYANGKAAAYRNLGVRLIPLSRYDSALSYFDSAFQELKRAENKHLESEIHNGVGIANEESGNYGEAIDHYLQSIEIRKSLNDIAGIGKMHNNLGKAYYSLGVYDSATSNLIKSLENPAISPSLKSSSMLILGTVKTSIGDFEEAKKLFEEALAMKRELNEPVPIATIIAWLGELNLLTGQLDEALVLYLESLELFKEIRHIKGAADLTAKVGEVHMKKSQFDSALFYYTLGLNDKKAIGDKQGMPNILIRVAMCHHGLKNYPRAINIAQEAVNVAQEINSKSEILAAYSLLHKLFAETNQLNKAYEYLNLYVSYKDSVLNEQKLKEIKTLETVYSVKELQKDKVQLEREKESQNLVYTAELRRQNAIKYGILGGLALVLLLALNYYRSFLRKKKANALLEDKNRLITEQKEDIEEQAAELKLINSKLEELSSFKEGLTHMIAHDMKNPLHVIISLSGGKIDKSKLKTIGESGKEMLNLVTNMLDVQKFEEAKMELKQVNVGVLKLVENALAQTELLMAAKSITPKVEIDQSLAIDVDKQLIERVLINILTNAIKYSPLHSTIQLNASIKDHQIEIRISDEGEGLSEQDVNHIFDKFWQAKAKKSGKAASTGLGLTFCKLAVEAHAGSIMAESEMNQGTTMIITLPPGSKLKYEEDTPVFKMDNDIVSAEELIVINQYIDDLKSLKVYQISKVQSILNELSAESDSQWVGKVKTAVFNSDQKKYDLLISQIIELQTSSV